jgi:hypothetical protein
MSGIIAANRLLQPTFELQAEGIDGFYFASQFEGSLSADLGNGKHSRLFNTDPNGYKWEIYNYNGLHTGPLKIKGNLNTCKSLNFNANSETNKGLIKFDISELAKMPNLEQAGVSHPTVYPTGDISSLPRKLKNIFFTVGYLEGYLKDIPDTVESFLISSNNKISGYIADIPQSVANFTLFGTNSITGLISDLKPTLKKISLTNTLGSFTGNIGDLKVGIESFYIGGQGCSISGDISEFPKSLKKITINCPSITITGKLSDLDKSVVEFAIYGNNTITGNINDLPKDIYFLVLYGSNSIEGNISNFGYKYSSIQVSGKNQITGDIAGIKADLKLIELGGNNAVYGDISDIKPSLSGLDIQGKNTLTGNIANLSLKLNGVTITGNNTIYGDLASIKRMSVIRIAGYATCHYTSTAWSSPMYEMSYTPKTTGLTELEVDQLIIDLSVPDWDAFRKIDLRGANAPRTSASDAAILVLQSKSVTILTN